jgi:glycosyltransferase involved in cell wall biosynthesis
LTGPVLHALAWPGGLGGAARSIEETCAAQLRGGLDAHVWLCTAARVQSTPVPDRFRARGVPVEHQIANTLAAPRAVASLTKALRRLGPGAVLHTHGARALVWGLVAAHVTVARHVHTLHGWVRNTPADQRREQWVRRLLPFVDETIAVHEGVGTGLPRCHVVPNTLDPRRFVRGVGDRERTRRHWGLDPHDKVYLFLGRLAPEKGADRLAVIQARLQTVSAAARLFVAGSGPLAAGVEAMTDVRLLGERDDPAAVLAAADVVLMPSRSEGLPMTALEAAAVGVPLVGFPAGGLVDSGLALTVPDGDVDALVDAAAALVREPEARTRVLARAASALDERFGPEAHVRALGAIYAGVA